MPEMATDCPHCGVPQTGFCLHAERNVNSSGAIGLVPDWATWWVCNRCTEGIIVKLQHRQDGYRNPPSAVQGAVHRYFTVAGIYPKPSIDRAPAHAPDNVSRNYDEAVTAISHRLYTSAGMTLRKALERATLALAPQPVSKSFRDKTLLARIESLRSQQVITEGLCELAKEIRTVGNAAAHDDEDLSKEETEQLREFTELFLIYTFTLPVRVAGARQPEAVPATLAASGVTSNA